MTPTNPLPTTRSQTMFAKAYTLAMEGRHRDSDQLLEVAHEMRAVEEHIAGIASLVPDTLSQLLITATIQGMDSETPVASILESNKEAVVFYVQNDKRIRDLFAAIRNPSPYEPAKFSLTKEELDAARQILAERVKHNPETAAVTDPTITPAAIAIKARGFRQLFTVGGQCDIQRQCPDCNGRFSTKLANEETQRLYWHCPHCNVCQENTGPRKR